VGGSQSAPPRGAAVGALDPESARRHCAAPNSETLLLRDTRHAEEAPTSNIEPWLTLPMTALPQDHGAVRSNGVETSADMASRTPVLAHRMKHDKSILALAVSSQYIFAGTQGGEILVRMARDMVGRCADLDRSIVSIRTSSGKSSRRIRAACWGSVCRKTRRCCSPVRPILS
jgi:hypothetical protein